MLFRSCKKYKDEIPGRRAILNMQKDNPEFQEAMDFAYYCYIQGKIDRLDYVSTAPLSELYPNLEHREGAEARRAELDTLKFLTAKLAPALSKRWDKAAKVEHTGIPEAQSGPQIAIISYAAPEQVETALDSVTEQHQQALNELDNYDKS